MSDVEQKLMSVFNKLGLFIDKKDEILELDSLTFISLIVEIEEEFLLEFPDEILIAPPLTFQGFFLVIDSLIKRKEEKDEVF